MENKKKRVLTKIEQDELAELRKRNEYLEAEKPVYARLVGGHLRTMAQKHL